MVEEIRVYSKDLSVLYVEDDLVIQKEMKELLEYFFDSVDIANNGEEALEKYKNKRYDIVFTDIEMPKMNGIELSRKLKEINLNQRIVIITAYNNPEYVYEAIDIGVDGFLIKPINMKKLVSVIKKISYLVYLEKKEQEFKKRLQEELNKKIKELEEKSLIDELTKLKNRNSLLRDIEKADVIYLLNINNFDSVNIIYGYEVGDEVLKYVANSLKKVSDKVYYLGDDEFAILEDVDVNFDIAPFKLDEIHSFPIDFTIGVARGDNLLKKAYLALKEAKKKRKKIVYYSEDLDIEKFHKKVQKYLPILKEALKTKSVIPVFQGIYDNRLGKITKYEVLARIKYNDEIISPFYFIDIAEKGGLITEITKEIIEKSFRVFSKNSFEFSINLTEIDLANDDLIEYLIKKSKEFNIEKNRIVLEVLEGIGEIENSIILDRLKLLKNLGFKISIDDFGTMNSNFERVTLLKVDYIKIDGKFIKNIDKDDKSFKIVKAITDFSKSIGAEVIAEFVTSKEIQDIIKSLGIDYSQGYLFSKPSEVI